MTRRPPTRVEVSEETLRSVVKIAGGVYYQPEKGHGPPQVLVTAEELNEKKITQDRWIAIERERLGMDGRF